MAQAQAEYAILGAGALGSIIGAHLARSGRSVLMLARGQRARDIETMGVRITGLANFSQPVRVLADASQFRSAEVLIVATKTHGTDEALQSIRHAEIGVAFSVQNGLMKDDQLAEVFGRGHVLGALADTSGELLPTGEALFTRNEQIYIGELDGGISERADRVASVMGSSGVRTRAVTGIEGLEWSKFAAWAGMMVLSVTTRAATWKFLTDPGTALVVVRLVREIGSLAGARGVLLSDRSPLPVSTILGGSESEAVAGILALGNRMRSAAPGHRMSSLQDLEAGRPLEIEETLGHAIRLAAQSNVRLPLLEACHALVAGIDRMQRLPTTVEI
jgi:2-dehydropantoate 2-reductase